MSSKCPEPRNRIGDKILSYAVYAIICIVPFAVFLVLRWHLSIVYETNDDVIIENILSGYLSGEPEFHTIVNNSLFTFPISVLYRIIPQVSWYGIMIMLIHVLSYILPALAILSGDKCIFHKIVVCCLYSISYYIVVYMQSRVQFTSTAMLAAFTGFLCILFHKKRKVGIIYFILLEMLAYGLRPESMEIVVPIGLSIYVGKETLLKTKSNISCRPDRCIIKNISLVVLILAAIVGIGIIADKLSYSNRHYAEAKSVNAARADIFDYMVFPEYEDAKNILNRYGISQMEYEAYGTYLNYDWDNSTGAIEEIRDSVKKELQINIPKTIKWVFVDSYKEWPWRLDKVIYVLLLIEIILIIFGKRISLLVLNLLYSAAKFVCWGYLYINGRRPNRIMFPLYAIEIMYLSAIVVLLLDSLEKQNYKNFVISSLGMISILLVGITSLYSVRDQYRYMATMIGSDSVLCNLQNEVSQYCNRNPENRYLLSPMVYSSWEKPPFTTWIDDNFAYGGGWFDALPTCQNYAQKYFSGENLYFIALCEEDDINGNTGKQLDYLSYKYKKIASMADEVLLSTGGKLIVYELN